MTSKSAALVLLMSFALFHPGFNYGQDVYGAIHGFVRDASGAPLQGAVVLVSSQEKGTQQKVLTNQSGLYVVTHLLPDTYDIKIEAEGRTALIPDISVFADQEQVANLDLPKGQQNQILAERPGGTMIKTRTDVSLTLSRNALQNLPTFNRNFTKFELLAPGTEQNPDPSPPENPQGGLQVSVNGQRPSGTGFLLDGTDNRDPLTASVIINPTIESVSQAKLTTQIIDAESGQALSGLFSVQTRSGSNDLHGSAFEYRRTDWGEAHNPNLNNPSLADIVPLHVNLFAGSLGGPLVRNKLFFFGDYQGTRRSTASTKALTVPTLKVRQTCLDASSPICDLSEYGVIIYDPKTKPKKPFDPIAGYPDCTQGFCIPRDRVPIQAVKLLSLLPAPTSGGLVQNYLANSAERFSEDDFNVRLDHNLSEKLKTFGRYSFADFRVYSPGAFGAAGGKGSVFDGFAGTSLSRNQGVSGGFDYALNPNWLTDFRFGYVRHGIGITAGSYNTNPALDAGIPNLNLGNSLTSGMPQIRIVQPRFGAGGGKDILFGDGPDANNCNCPLFAHLQQFQFVNNWAHNHGNHLIHFGADVRYLQDQRLSSDKHRAGQLEFNLKDTQGKDSQGLGLATFLLGDVTGFTRFVGNVSDAGERQKRLFFHLQDTWRASTRLTLIYGLRWEIYFPVTVTGKNDGGWLDLSNATIRVAGYPCCDTHGNVENSWRNFAPRIGIAYQLHAGTIIRAAYGRSFDAAGGQIFGPTVTQNPPVLLTQNLRPLGKNSTSVFSLAQGPPDPPAILFPDVPSSGLIAFNAKLDPDVSGVSANAVPTQLVLPTLDSWNLTVQQELSPNAYFELGYVGNKGTHMPPGSGDSNYNLNQPTIANYVAFGCFNAPQPDACQARYPYFNRFGWTQPVPFFGDSASTSYNSLQTKLVKRFSKGYQFVAHYVWAKGLGYDQDYFAINPRLNYGVNDFDRPHRFVLYNIVDLPVGKGRRLLGDAGTGLNDLVGGWSLSTITTWASGLPFSLSYTGSECNFDRDTGPCRPNQVGPVRVIGDRNNYFTTTGGVSLSAGPTDGSGEPGQPLGPWQRPAVGTFGDIGINSMRGPSFFDTDLVVMKSLRLRERYMLQFRTEFVNVFNRMSLANPNGCVDCPLSPDGLPTAAVITNLARGASPRQVEFALKLDF